MKPWKIILIAVSALVLIVPLTAYATVSMFADVPDDHIFVEDINWMKTAGVTQGCGDGTNYCPNDNVTRGQMAAFMHRLATGHSVDAGTLDGKNSTDYIYNAQWETEERPFSGVLPGRTVTVTASCPTNKHVVSGGGRIYEYGSDIQMAMKDNRLNLGEPGWTVTWINTGTSPASGDATVYALCAGPGLVGLPSPPLP